MKGILRIERKNVWINIGQRQTEDEERKIECSHNRL